MSSSLVRTSNMNTGGEGGSPFEYGRNYCQHDEEAILKTLFDKFGHGTKRLVDIGARLAGSNSWRLIEEWGWGGSLIDMNPLAVEELRERVNEIHAPVVVYEDQVTPDNVNDYVRDYHDFMSLDIDGNDFWVWAAVVARPKVCCIEFNAHYYQKWVMAYDVHRTRRIGKPNEGASLAAMVVLGELKGYKLVATTGINAIFVLKSVLEGK